MLHAGNTERMPLARQLHTTGITPMASARVLPRFPGIAGARQRLNFLVQEFLNTQQAQGDEGANTFNLRLHIETLILLRSDDPHGSQAARLVASLRRFRNTAHDVAPFCCWERCRFFVERHLTTIGGSASIFN